MLVGVEEDNIQVQAFLLLMFVLVDLVLVDLAETQQVVLQRFLQQMEYTQQVLVVVDLVVQVPVDCWQQTVVPVS
jgi:hypothetical protein